LKASFGGRMTNSKAWFIDLAFAVYLMNGVTGTFQGHYISGDTYMKLAGAYQVGAFTKLNILRIVTLGTAFGPAPYYGEEPYSGRRVLQGIKAGLNNK